MATNGDNNLERLQNQVNELRSMIVQLTNRMNQITAPPLHAETMTPEEPLGADPEGKAVAAPESSGSAATVELCPSLAEMAAHMRLEENKRNAKIKEKFRTLQGLEISQTVKGLTCYPELKVPETFDVLDFVKYDSIGCPKTHIQLYMIKMAPYAENVPLMIRTFLDSLTGPALQWYIKGRAYQKETWEEMSEAFMQKYKFNLAFALTRVDLSRTKKKKNESFKEYARRWHGMATQVCPALTEQEMIDLFLRTLPQDFYFYMIGFVGDTFSKLVPAGERVEN